MRYLKRFVAAAFISGAAAPIPAERTAGTPQTQQKVERCGGQQGVTPDQQIEACTALTRLAEQPNSQLSKAYSNRGDAFEQKRDHDRALADVNEAIRLDPNNAEAYNVRGSVYANQRDFGRAFADYNTAIRLDPTMGRAFYNRGALYDIGKNDGRAMADYDEAIRLNWHYPPVYINRGNI